MLGLSPILETTKASQAHAQLQILQRVRGMVQQRGHTWHLRSVRSLHPSAEVFHRSISYHSFSCICLWTLQICDLGRLLMTGLVTAKHSA